jgi:SprT protein
MQRAPVTHESIQLQVEDCFRLWGMFELAESVNVEFSGRLRVALGRSNVANHHVRLNSLLEKGEHGLLAEVLCHELAHIAVYERFGSSARPHGKEWAELVQKAGYEPRVRIRVDGDGLSKPSRKYEHICPVCQSVRYARRAMTRWRCGTCSDAGLDGQLLIRSIVDE